jgi:pilus assembly protein CpaB
MSKGARITLAVAMGLLAALFGMLYLSSQRDQIAGTAEVVRVYVASKDIKANTPLDPSLIGTASVPKRYLQPQSIPVTEVPDKSKVVGVTLVPIKEGEQIVRTKLFQGAAPPLSADLKSRPNTVAVAVEMKALPNSVHGLVRPGDHVDVLASFKFEKTKEEDFTEVRPLFQNLEVLAVNDKTSTPAKVIKEEKPSGAEPTGEQLTRTVTLAAAPAVAQQLILAQQLGSVWLLLRAPGDTGQHQYEIWNNERLLQSPYKLWRASNPQEELMKQLTKR